MGGIGWGCVFLWCEIKAKSAKIREYVGGFIGLGGFRGGFVEGVS